MPGDGTCLFHSCAHGLRKLGFSETGPSIRQRVAQFIADEPSFEITGTPLRSWVDWDSSMTVANYVSRLRAGNFWGGAIEMAACAQLFEVDLAVYEQDYFGGSYRRISDFLCDGQARGTLMLLYSGRAHYDAIEDLRPWQERSFGGLDEPAVNRCGTALEEEWGCSVM